MTLGAIHVFQVPESGWPLPIVLGIRPRGVWGVRLIRERTRLIQGLIDVSSLFRGLIGVGSLFRDK